MHSNISSLNVPVRTQLQRPLTKSESFCGTLQKLPLINSHNQPTGHGILSDEEGTSSSPCRRLDEVAPCSLKGFHPWGSELALEDLVQPSISGLPACTCMVVNSRSCRGKI